MKRITTKMIVAAGMLAALAALFQLVHVGYPTPWGMWIDLVGVPLMLAYFMYGFGTALIASIVTGLVITVFAPTSFLGALMKLTATIPMFLVPALVVYAFKGNKKALQEPQWWVLALILSIALRCALMLPLNYYWAIPLWTGMSAAEAIQFVPPYILIGLNALQGALEFSVAWLIAFKTRVKNLI